MPNREHHEVNRLSWNEGTKAHNSHKGDQAAFFPRRRQHALRGGDSRLLGNIDWQDLAALAVQLWAGHA